jgi:hypothetical protein
MTVDNTIIENATVVIDNKKLLSMIRFRQEQK